MKLGRRAGIGVLGESLAADFLARKGYQIIARNYRFREGEIDLIVFRYQPEPELVFVEVKARTSNKFGVPAEAVDSAKRSKLKRAVNYFRQRNIKLAKLNYRFDVVAVMINLYDRRAEIEWIKDAFV